MFPCLFFLSLEPEIPDINPDEGAESEENHEDGEGQDGGDQMSTHTPSVAATDDDAGSQNKGKHCPIFWTV